MSEKKVAKPIALAVGAALAGSFAMTGVASADTGASPFVMTHLSSGYMLGIGEGACGGGVGHRGRQQEQEDGGIGHGASVAAVIPARETREAMIEAQVKLGRRPPCTPGLRCPWKAAAPAAPSHDRQNYCGRRLQSAVDNRAIPHSRPRSSTPATW